MTHQDDLIEFLLLLGDSAMIQGQRLCEWCGHAPAIEEELGLMNVGLDLVGQARNWLEYAAELLSDGRTADDLVFRRDERAYRNVLLVEQPNGDFGVTMLKQFLYDAWHLPMLEGLAKSNDSRVAGVAAKAVKEVTYHLRRSSEWVQRLGDGTAESHQRMLAAIDPVWRYTIDFTSPGTNEQRLHEAGVGPAPQAVIATWEKTVAQVLSGATLPVPAPANYFYLGGRRGMHSEHLGIVLAEMQSLTRAYPDATW